VSNCTSGQVTGPTYVVYSTTSLVNGTFVNVPSLPNTYFCAWRIIGTDTGPSSDQITASYGASIPTAACIC
jgi:hypothetical protein